MNSSEARATGEATQHASPPRGQRLRRWAEAAGTAIRDRVRWLWQRASPGVRGLDAVSWRLRRARLPLPFAWVLTIALAVAVAGFALFLAGYPLKEGGCHTYSVLEAKCWRITSDLNMGERLKVAAGVITAIAALTALLISYRKREDEERNRFDAALAKAVDQLGSPSPTTRIAGAYAVAALGDSSKHRRQECVDVLCGYMRVPCHREASETALSTVQTTHTTDAGDELSRTMTLVPYDKEVRNTIIRLIAARLRKGSGRVPWTMMSFDFTGATIFDMDFKECDFKRDVLFNGANVMGDARFDAARFHQNAWLDGAQFHRDSWFDGAQFYGSAGFKTVQFHLGAGFKQARFHRDAEFGGAQFNDVAGFGEAQFNSVADFGEAQFNDVAGFGEAQFNSFADFGEAQFNGVADLGKAQFNSVARFGKAQFNDVAGFGEAQFNGLAGFGEAQFNGVAWFDKAQFHCESAVAGAVFAQPPHFDGCTLDGKPFMPPYAAQPTKPAESAGGATVDLRDEAGAQPVQEE